MPGDACLRPQWELPLVLEALVSDSYEPLERSLLKPLSFKTALLLALTLAKRVSDVSEPLLCSQEHKEFL